MLLYDDILVRLPSDVHGRKGIPCFTPFSSKRCCADDALETKQVYKLLQSVKNKEPVEKFATRTPGVISATDDLDVARFLLALKADPDFQEKVGGIVLMMLTAEHDVACERVKECEHLCVRLFRKGEWQSKHVNIAHEHLASLKPGCTIGHLSMKMCRDKMLLSGIFQQREQAGLVRQRAKKEPICIDLPGVMDILQYSTRVDALSGINRDWLRAYRFGMPRGIVL
ncbi:ankyrin repeat and EF-hand domain-containing protein 1-like, partial [Clarias magur]